MERKALSGEEAEFVGELCQYVRGHLASFAEAGKCMDERYSAAAFRQRREAEIKQFRAARARPFDHDLNQFVETGEPMYGADTIQSVANGVLPQKPGHRMGAAMDECASVQLDVDIDTERAEFVCLLTWLAWDEHAHNIQPHVCEFQSMEWLWDPAHTDVNRRQVQHDRITSAWVTLARKSLSLVKLRPATPVLPSHSAQASIMVNSPSTHPPAEIWLRDRAPVVKAQFEQLVPDIAKEEAQFRSLWAARRMMRVRDARDELRQRLRLHPGSLPPAGERWTYFRAQLRHAYGDLTDVMDAVTLCVREATEIGESLYAQVPLQPSFAAWVQFLMLVVFDARAGELPRVSPLQVLSNDWPGRPALQLRLRNMGLLDPLVRLSERAWVVMAQTLNPRQATGSDPESPSAGISSARCVVDPNSLRPSDVAALKVLLAEPDGAKPLSSGTLAERITNRHKVSISDSDFRKYVIPKLRPLLYPDTARGYRILSSMRGEAAQILEAALAR